ncbi:MAG: hypothetical protein IJX82_06585 [Clostridia bacterium]|nr:hypothetical protein [Clostridia bacterium]
MMRRWICLLLAVLTMLTCTACGEEDAPGDAALGYDDPYLYTQIGGVLHRISPYSASVTPVCPDPLCKHEDETCPLYGVENIQFAGQYLYYLKMSRNWDGTSALCRFDLKNGTFRELYRPEAGTLSNFYAGEDYVFLNLCGVDEEWRNYYHILRFDLAGGEAVQLTKEPLQESQTPLRIENGRVYWSGDGHYSTDLEYQDRKDGDRGYSPNVTRKDHVYELESSEIKGEEGYKQMCFRVVRVDVKTGERVTVTEDAASAPILYEDRVIYGKLEKLRYLGKVYDEETDSWKEQYDKYGGKLYICNSDGTGERVLCDLGDAPYAFTVSHGILGGKTGVGDWIALWVFRYVPADENDPEKVKRAENAYLLVNVKTGEWKVAERETRS